MILVKNGFLVTMDGENNVFRDGAALVERDRIFAVGKTEAGSNIQSMPLESSFFQGLLIFTFTWQAQNSAH